MTPASTTRATSADPVLAALRALGSRIRTVRYRANRTVLLSVSRDGRTLNCHRCFRAAPADVIRAVAVYVTARPGTRPARQALRRIRGWDGAQAGLEAVRKERSPRRRAQNGPDTAPLRALYDRFNQERFGAMLPEIPLRVSRRMRRTLGTARYGEAGVVQEIAISADLLLPVNRAVLEDTMLHEMAHAEAWIRHGHRGHGPVWRQIARRVGCTPRALCRGPIARG